MFTLRYFTSRFFPNRFFPKIGAAPLVDFNGVTVYDDRSLPILGEETPRGTAYDNRSFDMTYDQRDLQPPIARPGIPIIYSKGRQP